MAESPQDERRTNDRLDAISDALARMLRRQEEIEQRLGRVEAALFAGQKAPPASAPQPMQAPPAPPPIPVSAPLPPTLSTRPPLRPAPVAAAPVQPKRALETNIGLTLVNRIGVITLVLGVGFFFKWAVDNQWIGPAGRVVLGIVVGFATLWAGDRLWRSAQRVFAQGVTGAGICILYLAVYSAFGFYQLLPQPFAFLLMIAITALSGGLALLYDARAIAALAMFGGFITPVLLSTGQDHPWFLFTYLLILDAAAVALARVRSWAFLNVLGFIGTTILYGAWLADKFRTGSEAVATFYDLVYYALFTSTLVLRAALFSQSLAALAVAAIWAGQPAPFFVVLMAVAAGGLIIGELRRSGALVAAAFVSAWISYAAWVIDFRSPRPAGAIFSGVIWLFALFIAWLLWWTAVHRRPARKTELAILALNGVFFFSAGYSLLNAAYHAWMGLLAIFVAAIYLVLGWFIWKAERSADMNAVTLALAFAAGYLTLAIPIQLTGYRITMAWAAEGAATAWIGARLNEQFIRVGAAVVLVLTVVRLFLFDAWIFPDPHSYTLLWNARFIAFFVAVMALWGAAWWASERAFALLYYVAGHGLLLASLTMEDLGWAVRNSDASNLLSVETVSISILWATYAVALVAFGVLRRFGLNRLLGLVLLAVVVLKLYVFDVWQVARVFRIMAFVALGVLLIATSYLYSRFRSAIGNWLKDETPSP